MNAIDIRAGRRHPWVRWVFILGALVVVLSVLGLLALPRLLDINTYRSRIQSEASRRLGRQVTVGKMEMTALPLPTAVIHDVVVSGQGLEGNTVLTAATLRARARLAPLLFARRLELTELTLDQPAITLLRGDSGRWNWQEMLDHPPAGAGAPSAAPTPMWSDERLTITEGRVHVLDAHAESGRTIDFVVAPLDLALRSNGPGRGVDVDVDGTLSAPEGRGTFGFRGRAGPLPDPFAAERLPLEGVVKAGGFPLRVLFPYIRSENGIVALDGIVTTDMELAMRPGAETRAKGKLELDHVRYALAGPAARSGMLDLDSSFDLSSMNGRKDLDLRELELKLPEGRLSIAGEVRSATENPRFTWRVDGTHLRLADLEPLANLAGVELPREALGPAPFDVTGTIERQVAPDGNAHLILQNLRLRGIEGAIYRGPAGTWSWQRVAMPAASAGPPTAVQIDGLRLERSTITVTDASGRAIAPLRLTGVELTVDHFGSGAPGHGSLQAMLADGGKIDAEGTIGPVANGQRTLDLDLRLDRAPVAILLPYVSTTGARPAAGSIDLDASIHGRSPERLAVKGTMGLGDVAIDLRTAAGGTTRQVLKGNVVFDAVLQSGGLELTFNSCRVTLPNGAFGFSGTLDRRGGGSLADITVTPTRLAVADLESLAALAGVSIPGAMSSPDPIEVSLHARGNLADRRQLNLAGSLRATRLTWNAPFLQHPLTDVDTRVQFQGDGFAAKGFTAKLGETALAGDLSLQNFAAPVVTFAITSDRADLGQLLADLSGGGSAQSQSVNVGATAGGGNTMTGRGTVLIKAGTFHTLAFSDLQGTVAMDGPTIRVAPLAFTLYGGKYAGESAVDLRGPVPRITHRCAFTGVDANALLSANTNLKDVLHGTLSGHLGAAGAGKTMDDLLHSLDGSGDFTVVNGTLTRSSMLKGMSDVAGLFGERTLTQISQKMTTNETPFSTLSASFRAAGGQLATDDLRLVSPDFTLTAKGRAGLDRKLGFSGRIIFSDAISQTLRAEGSRAVYLGAENGRVAVPVMVGGTIDRPTFDVDFGSAATYAVAKTITDRLAEGLKRREKSPPAPPPATPGTPPPAPPPATQETSPPAPPPPAPQPATPGTSPPAPAPATQEASPAGSDLQVRVTSHQFRGNLLQMQLELTGTVAGSHLASLLVIVSDDQGKEVHRATALEREITAAYGQRSRDDRVTVPFTVRIAPGDMPPPTSKSLRVALYALSDQGRRSAAATVVERRPPSFFRAGSGL
jgi:uncharacterized protein involved in outer membrane biogenesis